MRAVNQDAFDLGKLKPHGARLLGAEHDGRVRPTVVAQAQFQTEGVQAGRHHDACASLGLQQRLPNGLWAVHAQFLGDACNGFFQRGGLLAFAQRRQRVGGWLAFKVALCRVQRRQQHGFQFVVAFQPAFEVPDEFLGAAAAGLGHEVLTDGAEGQKGGCGSSEQ